MKDKSPLHTDAREKPFGPLVLLHWLLWRVIIMREAIGKPNERRVYVASAVITPWHWLFGHWDLFRRLNKKLRDGGSAGVTFRDESGLPHVQNQLDLIKIPVEYIPNRLRRKPDATDDDAWWIEVYELGSITLSIRRFLQYAVFGEFCPQSVSPPEGRVRLGSRLVWWLAGRPREFTLRLHNQDEKDAPPRLLATARFVGKAKARALLPLLFLLAVFAREKKKA